MKRCIEEPAWIWHFVSFSSLLPVRMNVSHFAKQRTECVCILFDRCDSFDVYITIRYNTSNLDQKHVDILRYSFFSKIWTLRFVLALRMRIWHLECMCLCLIRICVCLLRDAVVRVFVHIWNKHKKCYVKNVSRERDAFRGFWLITTKMVRFSPTFSRSLCIPLSNWWLLIDFFSLCC